MKKKRIYVILGIVLGLLIVAAVVKKQNSSEGVEVTSEQVETRTIIEVVSATGSVQPEREVAISPEVPGELIELPVKEGQKVEQGDLLVRINPDLYLAAVNRAEAGLNTSRANVANSKARLEQAKARLINSRNMFDRQQKLFNDKVISDADFENSKADFEVAEAEVRAAEQSLRASEYNARSAEATLKEARDNLKRTTIYAPMNGTVSKLAVELGERVVGTSQMAGTEMMRVADLTNMEVNAEVNESDIVRVKLGDEADIEIDAYTNRKFRGVVTEMANSSDQSAVHGADQLTVFNVKVRILPDSYADLVDPDNPHLSPFRPGMSASVEILTDQVDETVAVPIQSVTVRPDSSMAVGSSKRQRDKALENVEDEDMYECVFVVVNGRAEQRKVEIGIQDSRYMQIKSGLAAGEEVITGPYSVVSKELMHKDEVVVKSKLDIFSEDEE